MRTLDAMNDSNSNGRKLVGTSHGPSEFEKPPKRVKGKVHTYSYAVNSGTIIADGQIYLFSQKDWLSEKQPVSELTVLFIAERNWARSITLDGSEK